MEGAGDFSNFWAAVRDERSWGTETFCFTFLPASQLYRRTPWAPQGHFLRAPYLSLFEERYGRKTNQGGCGPRWIPWGNVLGHSDVLCAYHLAMVRVTRLSRAWRAPHCFHALCVLRPDGDAKRHRRKCPWGALLRKTARLTQPPNFRPQIRPDILSVPTNSPQLEQYN